MGNRPSRWVRLSTIALVILASASLFVSACLFVTNKGSNIAIIARPAAWTHVGFLLIVRSIMAMRTFHFSHIRTSGLARRRVVLVVPTFVSLVIVAWTIGGMFIALHAIGFIG